MSAVSSNDEGRPGGDWGGRRTSATKLHTRVAALSRADRARLLDRLGHLRDLEADMRRPGLLAEVTGRP